MKTRIPLLFAPALALCSSLSASDSVAEEKKLSTGTQYQQHNLWCWAATCRNALKHFIDQPTQCEIVNWWLDRSDCCGNGTFKWEHPCNKGQKIDAMYEIISAWERDCSVVNTYLKFSTAQSLINNDSLFTMRFAWTSGGAHHILGVGWRDTGSKKYIARMDPWPGEGSSWTTYSSTVSSSKHKWTDTLKIY